MLRKSCHMSRIESELSAISVHYNESAINCKKKPKMLVIRFCPGHNIQPKPKAPASQLSSSVEVVSSEAFSSVVDVSSVGSAVCSAVVSSPSTARTFGLIIPTDVTNSKAKDKMDTTNKRPPRFMLYILAKICGNCNIQPK